MHSLITVSLLAALASVSTTQQIQPDSVDIRTREQWCTNQKASCPLICAQVPGATDQPASNDCTAEDLNWQCVCSNGITPNASEFSQTIPFYECTETNNKCVAACKLGDNTCSDNCRNSPGRQCGARNPTRVNVTSTTAAGASATAAQSSGIYQGSGFGGGNGGSGKGAATATLDAGRIWGLLATTGVISGAFAFLL